MAAAEAKTLMKEGDTLLTRGQILYDENLILRAELCYSRAVELDRFRKNDELYLRRSAARTALGDHVKAVKDAETAISVYSSSNSYSISTTRYARKGFALAAQSRFLDAIEAYKIATNPRNVMIEKEFAQVKNTYDTKYKDLIEKLEAKPHTREWLNDPEYLENVKKIAQGSWYLQEYVNECGDSPDWRVFHTHSILSGLDKHITISGKSDEVNDSTQGSQDKRTSPLKAIELQKPNHEDIPQQCRPTLQEIDLGIEAYKKKDFDNALKHYQKALEFDPTNMIIYTNIATVYFQQKKYELCIKECDKAVDVGRKNGADCKSIAEAFTCIGNAYAKMGLWTLSMTYYEKSITEHQSPETKELLEKVKTLIHVEEIKTDKVFDLFNLYLF